MSERQLIATIISEPHPQEGQEHRSSGNFSYHDLPAGTLNLEWEIDPNTTSGADVISFDVWSDISFGTDDPIFSGVMSGNRTPVKGTNDKLYIANPSHATQNFTVNVFAILY
ncbi:hypothetical protein CBW65_09105 [Tumebacillus avium]|uniref:DeoR family transcriptional regulator n=1 Tax=Tumebacillus avium TaxID=1903704 RepID=A0A1Y0IP97_9BACL|nr:hypothetical protein [Tumebacillus avium]ARU61173.1 hypothetical protein CBW65_09105 [Tumebacillus avium]